MKLDILSWETCLSWIASELNNLPICIGSKVDNLDHVDVITPSRLLLGRNNRRALSGYVRSSTPSRLIAQMDKVYDVWWNVWRTEKLVDFIPQPSKWKKTNEQLKEGDVSTCINLLDGVFIIVKFSLLCFLIVIPGWLSDIHSYSLIRKDVI